jgi:5-hydroxyisourate hydrolase
MGQLTTHVLDTVSGCPGRGITVRLFRDDQPDAPLLITVTNADGRCDAPLLQGEDFVPGRYRLEFAIGAYFSGRGAELTDPPFLDQVVLHFGIADPDQNYHVPLLVSPWAYSTYRGS